MCTCFRKRVPSAVILVRIPRTQNTHYCDSTPLAFMRCEWYTEANWLMCGVVGDRSVCLVWGGWRLLFRKVVCATRLKGCFQANMQSVNGPQNNLIVL